MPAIHLSGEFNITYIQVPKVAGTSVGHWVKNYAKNSKCSEWYDHPTPSKIHETHEKNFTFSIVRNPWDRMVSLYFFLKNFSSPQPQYKDSGQLREMLYRINNYVEFPTYEQWLKNADEFKFLPWIWWEIKTPQHTWTDVDLIIKYENLENEFCAIQDIFKCYDPLPKQTVTKGIYWNHYHNLYTDETKYLVGKMFEEDIDRWKYTF